MTQQPKRGGTVVTYSCRASRHHESVTLLELGRVRIKLPAGIGGLGQSVVDDERALDTELHSLDEDALLRDGLVLEQDLAEVVTHSVGQVCVGDMRASYCGVQRLTTNHH